MLLKDVLVGTAIPKCAQQHKAFPLGGSKLRLSGGNCRLVVSELGSREILRLAAGGNDGSSGKTHIGRTGLLHILGVDALSPVERVGVVGDCLDFNERRRLILVGS